MSSVALVWGCAITGGSGSGTARCPWAGHGLGHSLELALPLVLLGLGSVSPGSGTTAGLCAALTSGLLQKEPVLWALLQISLSLPGNLTLLFYHVVTVFVFTAYLYYSHVHEHVHEPTSCFLMWLFHILQLKARFWNLMNVHSGWLLSTEQCSGFVGIGMFI